MYRIVELNNGKYAAQKCWKIFKWVIPFNLYRDLTEINELHWNNKSRWFSNCCLTSDLKTLEQYVSPPEKHEYAIKRIVVISSKLDKVLE